MTRANQVSLYFLDVPSVTHRRTQPLVNTLSQPPLTSSNVVCAAQQSYPLSDPQLAESDTLVGDDGAELLPPSRDIVCFANSTAASNDGDSDVQGQANLEQFNRNTQPGTADDEEARMDCLERRVHGDDNLTCKDFKVNMAQFEQEHDLGLLRQFASEVDSHTTDEIQLDSSHYEY